MSNRPIQRSWIRRLEIPAWLLLLAAAGALRFYRLDARALSYDEGVHAIYSHHLYQHNQYRHTPITHGPFLFLSNAAIFHVFGESDATIRSGQALAGTAIVLLLWWFRRYLGRIGAWMAALLLTISPVFLFYSRYARNDVYIALFLLVWVYAGLRFLRTRRVYWLVLVTTAMALSFAVKEVSFINGIVIGSFFAALAAMKRRRRPLLARSALDLAFLMFTLAFPFLSPVFRPDSYYMIAAFFMLDLSLVCLGFMLGLWSLGWRTWGRLMALFWFIDLSLFTTLYSNLSGILTGVSGSLGYWLAQHGVQRGSQPWFYYPFLAVVYEFLPLALSLSGIAFLARRIRRGNPIPLLLAWWIAGSWILYSVAGEKMPWLLTHPILPCCLCAGWAFQQWMTRPVWMRAAIVSVTGALLLATFYASWRLNYVHYDQANEFLVYAHGTPDFKAAMQNLKERELRARGGTNSTVMLDQKAMWPIAWYLRDMTYRYFPENPSTNDLLDVRMLVVDQAHLEQARALTGGDYKETRFRLIWWPVEFYKDIDPVRPWRAWNDPEMRHLLRIALTTRNFPMYAYECWPQRQDAYLFVRTRDD